MSCVSINFPVFSSLFLFTIHFVNVSNAYLLYSYEGKEERTRLFWIKGQHFEQ